MERSFLVVCKCTILGDQKSSGPYHNKFNERFNTPYFNFEVVGLFKNITYYCTKNEANHYRVFCNDSNGSYNYVFIEDLFKQHFYSEKELRVEKIKKLNESNL